MGIKVFKKDNKIIAKGIPNVSSLGILAGILILFLCFLSQSSPRPINVLVIAIFGMIIIIASIIHAIRERQKKLREYQSRYTSRVSPQNTAAGVKCSNCGNLTGTLNKFCPNCGTSLESIRQQKYEEELEEARRKLDEDKKHLAELVRKRGLIDTKGTHMETKLEKNEGYRRLADSQPNEDKQGNVENKEEKGQKKSLDLTAGLQDASNVVYGASYVTDVQNNSDDDTSDNDDDYDEQN
jgi:hypothetical protein